MRALGPSAPKYRPGSTLANGKAVTLVAGDTLVLLDAKGSQILRGPVTVTIGSAVAAAANQVAGLADRRRARIGAVRGVPDMGSQRPNLWFVDTATSGAMCVADPANLMLWRADPAKAGTATLSSGDRSAEVSWAAGQSVQPWPAALPIADGARVAIAGLGAAPAGTQLTLKLVKPAASEPQAIAQSLIGADCQGQIDLLVAQTAGS